MSTARKFTREDCARAEAEMYLSRLRQRIAYRQGVLKRVGRANKARTEAMERQARSYLEFLDGRAHSKAIVQAKIAKKWKWQNEFLRKQADAYRKWLRRFMSPEQMDYTEPTPETTVETYPSDPMVTRHMTLVQSGWYSDRPAGAAS
jgi:hypothetical protein